MKPSLLVLAVSGAIATLFATAQAQTSKLRVGVCTRTISSVHAPYAIATKMGWFREEGIEVTLVPLAGSADCIKNVTSKEIPFAQPAIEPLPAARIQGVKAKTYYTASQGNQFGIAVPANSAIEKISDLKGKTIGLISMGSAGLWVGKGLVAMAGLDPERDVRFVVAGEGPQTAAMLRTKQVDALCEIDAQYAMVENAGVKLRLLSTKEIEHYPSNGFLALEETIRTHRKEAVGLARGYAKGTIFAISNPEAAVRIFYEVYPETKPTGKDEATIIREGVRVLESRIPNWSLEKGGVKRWGENSEANYASYMDFLLKWGVIKRKVDVKDLITNELIDEINKFDQNKIAAEAQAYKRR
jgi:NitT/TauT family transport system substrate-binding protein